MSITREESAIYFYLLMGKIGLYEPALYDEIKKQVVTKELLYSVKYENYKLGNWIEKNRLNYWNKMSYFEKILFYLNLKVPEKLRYWSNYPLSFIYRYCSSEYFSYEYYQRAS